MSSLLRAPRGGDDSARARRRVRDLWHAASKSHARRPGRPRRPARPWKVVREIVRRSDRRRLTPRSISSMSRRSSMRPVSSPPREWTAFIASVIPCESAPCSRTSAILETCAAASTPHQRGGHQAAANVANASLMESRSTCCCHRRGSAARSCATTLETELRQIAWTSFARCFHEYHLVRVEPLGRSDHADRVLGGLRRRPRTAARPQACASVRHGGSRTATTDRRAPCSS